MTMREFFPNYNGPLKDRIVWKPLPHRPDSGANFQAAAESSGEALLNSSNQTQPSEVGEKSAPLGCRLDQLGKLVSERFLEVALHSKSTGGGLRLKYSRSPLQWNHLKGFW